MRKHHRCHKEHHEDHKNNSEYERAGQVRRDNQLQERHEIDLKMVPGFFEVKALERLEEYREMRNRQKDIPDMIRESVRKTMSASRESALIAHFGAGTLPFRNR